MVGSLAGSLAGVSSFALAGIGSGLGSSSLKLTGGGAGLHARWTGCRRCQSRLELAAWLGLPAMRLAGSVLPEGSAGDELTMRQPVPGTSAGARRWGR